MKTSKKQPKLGNSHTERIKLNEMPLALVCAINSFNGVLCGKMNNTHKRQLLSYILGRLEELAANFRRKELSLGSLYAPISSTLLQSVSDHVHCLHLQETNGHPLRSAKREGCQSNQSSCIVPDYASISARAQFLLGNRSRWRVLPLPRASLHQTVCPLCSQAIRKGKKNVALTRS